MLANHGAEFVIPFSSCSHVVNFLFENIIIWVKTLPFFAQMMIFSPNTSFWMKKGVIWWLFHDDLRAKARGKRNHKFRTYNKSRHVPKSKNLGGHVVMRRLLICQNLGGHVPPLPPPLVHAWSTCGPRYVQISNTLKQNLGSLRWRNWHQPLHYS